MDQFGEDARFKRVADPTGYPAILTAILRIPN